MRSALEATEEKGAREIRVFISSTFRDMQAEREELIKRVFPDLRRLCRERGVELTEIDLRWGVTEAEARQGKVLKICLDEIDRCRPYFIGILGDRYGWQPTLEELGGTEDLLATHPWVRDLIDQQTSVTELEFLHGALRNPTPPVAYFYLRKEAPESATPSEGPEVTDRLNGLKQAVRESGLPCREGYSDAATLGQWVREDLLRMLDERFPIGLPPSPLAHQRQMHEAFAASRLRGYVEDEDLQEHLDRYAIEGGPPLAVLGDSGVGKSALLASWVRSYRTRYPEAFVVAHYVGAGSAESGHLDLFQRVMGEIRDRCKVSEPVPTRPDEIEEAFPRWLGFTQQTGLVLVLDAVNQFEGASASLGWMPEPLPSWVRLIVSTLDGPSREAMQRRSWPTLRVDPLDTGRRERLILSYLSGFRKVLNEEQRDFLVTDPKCSNPLFLRTVLEELRIFGSFDDLTAHLRSYLTVPGLDGLFERVLTRMERDHGVELVSGVLGLIGAARRGLSESEILDLTGCSRQALSQLLPALDYHLMHRDGLLTFFHDYLRRAVRTRYAARPEDARALHRRLADYFERRVPDVRKAEELPWQLDRAEEFERLATAITDSDLARRVHHLSRYDLPVYWGRLEERGLSRSGIAYAPVLESPELVVDNLDWLADLFDQLGHKDLLIRLLREGERWYRNQGTISAFRGHLSTLAVLLFWQRPPVSGEVISPEELNAQEAMRLLHEQQALCEETGDHDGLQMSLGTQAQLLIWSTQYWLAIDLLEKQRLVCEETGNRRGLVRVLGNLAFVRNILIQPDAALTDARRAEFLAREAGDLYLLTEILDGLGEIYKDRRLPYEAVGVYQQEVDLARSVGYRSLLRLSLSKLGQTYLYLGAAGTALARFVEEEKVARDLADEKALAQCLARQEMARQGKGHTGNFTIPRPNFVDPGRRDGIIALLSLLGEEPSVFLPREEVLVDLMRHAVGFVLYDTLLHPDCGADLARTSAAEYLDRLEQAQSVIGPTGEALYRHRPFLNSSREKPQFTDTLQYVGSRLVHQVLPAKGIPEPRIHQIIHPYLRCSLLLMGHEPSSSE